MHRYSLIVVVAAMLVFVTSSYGLEKRLLRTDDDV